MIAILTRSYCTGNQSIRNVASAPDLDEITLREPPRLHIAAKPAALTLPRSPFFRSLVEGSTLPVDSRERWQRTNIGTNSRSYMLVAADEGRTIQVRVSLTAAAGNAGGSLTSTAETAYR